MLEKNEPEDLDLEEIYAFAIDLGRGAGKILLDVFQARCAGSIDGQPAHTEKESAVDLVTQTDEGKIKLPKASKVNFVSAWGNTLSCLYDAPADPRTHAGPGDVLDREWRSPKRVMCLRSSEKKLAMFNGVEYKDMLPDRHWKGIHVTKVLPTVDVEAFIKDRISRRYPSHKSVPTNRPTNNSRCAHKRHIKS